MLMLMKKKSRYIFKYSLENKVIGFGKVERAVVSIDG
jgi:hypothetical protein